MDPYIGEIGLVAFDYAPEGWLPCNGQTVNISDYTTLFSVIGTTYGGNGTSNFMLPALNFPNSSFDQSRMIIGVGKNPVTGTEHVLGSYGGTMTVTLTSNNLPTHNHPGTCTWTTAPTATSSVTVTNAAGDKPSPVGNQLAISNSGTGSRATTLYTYTDSTDGTTLGGVTVTGGAAGNTLPISVAQTGYGQPISICAPSVCMNYIIATEGTYPSPN